MKKPDDKTNMADDSFLLDEPLPKAPVVFKRHMARKFLEMGYDKEKIRKLLMMME